LAINPWPLMRIKTDALDRSIPRIAMCRIFRGVVHLCLLLRDTG
jgi:hypothetical protein